MSGAHAKRLTEVDVLHRGASGLEAVLTRHRETGRLAVQLRRLRVASGHVEKFDLRLHELEALCAALRDVGSRT